MKKFLGLEFGSTRIKAVLIDEHHATVSAGDYTWKSSFENGVWTYPLEEAWKGLNAALAGVEGLADVAAVGVSGMMHGYLAFDKDWNLLVPFRTWQNTMTAQAAEELTGLFGFNIPQRWSIAHLYQAVLNGEEHISRIAHITTLAGYIHHALTGVNAVGVGEASGIFPIDGKACGYDEAMLDKFDALIAPRNLPWKIRDVLPKPLVAGGERRQPHQGGCGASGRPAQGGRALCPRRGRRRHRHDRHQRRFPAHGQCLRRHVHLRHGGAGTRAEEHLSRDRRGGHPRGRAHGHGALQQLHQRHQRLGGHAARNAGAVRDERSPPAISTPPCNKKSLEGAGDCDGVLVYNYMAGEGVTHLDSGRPLVMRRPDSEFSLANFMRSQIYGAMATMCIGMEILHKENVAIDSLTGHGGLFKTPGVAQRYMAAACKAPVTCMETAGEGGPYGMALLASYMVCREEGESLGDYLNNKVFANAKGVTLAPDPEDVKGFEAYLQNYVSGLAAEKAAVR